MGVLPLALVGVAVLGVDATWPALAVGAVQVGLGLLFLGAGGGKLAGQDDHVENFEQWRYPQWFRVVTGVVEVSGAVAVLAGLLVPTAAVLGGVLIAGSMAGAVYTHVVRVDEADEAPFPAVLFVLAVVVLVTALA